MKCFYCRKEGQAVDASGQCRECNKPVCTYPPSRFDKVFHGEECQCGCSYIVCDPHAGEHASSRHGSLVPQCFPILVVSIAASAFEVCTRLLTRTWQPQFTPVSPPAESASWTPSANETRAIDRMLRTVFPGRGALVKGLRELPLRLQFTYADRFQFPLIAAGDLVHERRVPSLIETWPLFRKKFFRAPSRIEQVALFASRAIGEAASLTRITPHSLFSPSRLATLPAFAHRRTPGGEALLAWLPGGSSFEDAEAVRGVIAQEFPDDPHEAARWLLSGRSSR